jgi:hypothetical protein
VLITENALLFPFEPLEAPLVFCGAPAPIVIAYVDPVDTESVPVNKPPAPPPPPKLLPPAPPPDTIR